MEWIILIFILACLGLSHFQGYLIGLRLNQKNTKKRLKNAKEIMFAQQRQIAKLHEQLGKTTVEFQITEICDIEQYLYDSRN